jgi:serine/threonine protein kinase
MFKTPTSSKQLAKVGISKDDYEFGPLIGEGGLGLVFKATAKANSETVAIKAMRKK